MEDQEDQFIKHATLIMRQVLGTTVAQARWIAWSEGPEGYAKRLVEEADFVGKMDE